MMPTTETVMISENDMFDKDQFEALCKQEREYNMAKEDYLARLPLIDAVCREKVVIWFLKVVEYCQFDRETVEIALDYLDRFLSNEEMVKADTTTRDDFKEIAMTCLYVAVKIHEPIAVDSATLASLSGGALTKDGIETCERELLRGLEWRMNPPTTLSFVRLALSHLKLPQLPESQVLKLCHMQFEQVFQEDYNSFIATLPSTLAAVALHNSLLSLGYEEAVQMIPFSSSPMDTRMVSRFAQTLSDDLPSSASRATATKQTSLVRHASSSGGTQSPKCVSCHP